MAFGSAATLPIYQKNRRGNTTMLFEGYEFTLNRRYKDTRYWECTNMRAMNKTCKARIVTNYHFIKVIKGKHDHPQTHNPCRHSVIDLSRQ